MPELEWSFLIRVIIGAIIFAFSILAILYSSDVVLARYLPGYKHSGQYGIALIIFFVFATFFLLFGKSRGWDNWRYFVIGPIAIFIPLVFIATSFRYAFGLENAFTSYHIALHCTPNEGMCGKAFAYVFFSMALRAVPTIVIISPLYLLVRRVVFTAKSASKT